MCHINHGGSLRYGQGYYIHWYMEIHPAAHMDATALSAYAGPNTRQPWPPMLCPVNSTCTDEHTTSTHGHIFNMCR